MSPQARFNFSHTTELLSCTKRLEELINKTAPALAFKRKSFRSFGF